MGLIDEYGYNPHSLLTSQGQVSERLRAILGDKVMRFDPYSVDDETLLACVGRATWQPFPALTQMVAFHFHDIRRVNWVHPYDAIHLHIGDNPNEIHIPIWALSDKLTYNATLRQTHVTVNGKPVTNPCMVESLQNKSYFVSHALMCTGHGGKIVPAYRMFRLYGTSQRKATMIRERMMEAKITILNEILSYPYSPDYLQCKRNLIDYSTPIESYISEIKRRLFTHEIPDKQ